MFNFKKKCCLCGKKDMRNNLAFLCALAYEHDYFFHTVCLKEMICNPNEYTEQQVDQAIYIQERLLRDKQRHAFEEISRQQRIKEAQAAMRNRQQQVLGWSRLKKPV